MSPDVMRPPRGIEQLCVCYVLIIQAGEDCNYTGLIYTGITGEGTVADHESSMILTIQSVHIMTSYVSTKEGILLLHCRDSAS